MLESYRLRLKIKCTACATVLGIQRLAGKVRCERCSQTLALRELWQRAALAELDDPEPRSVHLPAGATSPEAWLEFQARAPRCDQCQDAALDLDHLDRELAAKRRPACPTCKAPVRLRLADGIAQDLHPGARMIVAEGPDKPAEKPDGREDLYLVCEVDRRVKKRVVPPAEQPPDATERARRASRAAQDALRADHSEEQLAAGALTDDEALRLAEHDDWEVRLALAHNPEAPPVVLERLARGDDATVRAAVAQHPALPASLFAQLARDPWPDVRRSIAKHPATPVELRQLLAGDTNDVVRAEVAKRGVTSAPAPASASAPPAADEPTPTEPTTVTLVGRVVDDALEPRFIQARLQIDDESHQRVHAARFMLQLDDGAVVAVEPAGARVGALDKRTTRWDEIAATPVGQLFADVAPGDHVEVTLAAFTIAPGARIAVRGLAQAKPEDAASAVRAQHLAIVEGGDDAAAIASMDPPPPKPLAPAPAPEPPKPPKPPAEPRPWRITAPVMLALGAAALVYGIVQWRPLYEAIVLVEFPVGLALLEIAASFALMAIGLWASRVPFELTESTAPTDRGSPRQRVTPWWGRGKAVLLLGFVAMFTMLGMDGCGAADSSFAWVGAAPLVLAVVGALLAWVLRPREHLRFARLVLGAPQATTGASGTIEGTVQDIHTAVARTVEYTRQYNTRTEQVRNKDGSYSTREVTTSWLVGESAERPFERFSVHGPQGRHEIVGGRATWGAPIKYVRPTDNRAEIVTRAKIGNGDSLIALGRLATENGQPVMNATGHESVVMFGAPADARTTLARLVARTSWLAIGMLAIVALAIATTILIWTEDPPTATTPSTWPPVAPRMLPGERL